MNSSRLVTFPELFQLRSQAAGAGVYFCVSLILQRWLGVATTQGFILCYSLAIRDLLEYYL